MFTCIGSRKYLNIYRGRISACVRDFVVSEISGQTLHLCNKSGAIININYV